MFFSCLCVLLPTLIHLLWGGSVWVAPSLCRNSFRTFQAYQSLHISPTVKSMHVSTHIQQISLSVVWLDLADHSHHPHVEPPTRWPSRSGPAPAGGWVGAGRRAEHVQPAVRRQACLVATGPGRSHGCHHHSTGAGGFAEHAPPPQLGCHGSAGVYPGRQSKPRASTACSKTAQHLFMSQEFY